MKTFRSTALLSLILSSVVVVAPAAGAGPTTCQGQAVTMVGVSGAPLTGTGSDDVIVTNGAEPVNAGAGDDLVCVTGVTVVVDAGEGNDTVDSAERSGSYGYAVLGEGDDVFTGGPYRDYVVAGTAQSEACCDDGTDSISTGGGWARVKTGQDDLPNDDAIVFGTTNRAPTEVIFRGIQAAGGAIEFGGQFGQVSYRTLGDELAAWVIDNREQRILADGQLLMTWSGTAERFSPDLGRHPHRTLAFRGNARREILEAVGPLSGVRLAAQMGRGHDEVQVGCNNVRAGSWISFGIGKDFGIVNRGGGCLKDVVVRLDRGLLTNNIRVRSLENLEVTGQRVDVHGTGKANQMEITGCEGAVHGGDGPDLVYVVRRVCRNPGPLQVYGGAGGDALVGSRRDDFLVGGPGNDSAYGYGGIDTCRAEMTRNCELG